MAVTRLTQDNIEHFSSSISCPNYNRKALKTGIVHIGVGGFHRSHQAYYIHQLLQNQMDFDWGICGVGLREADRKIYNIFKKQDCLYTLMVQHPDGTTNCEVIGSIKQFLLAIDTPDLVIDKMAHPDTKIVSLTITEGGYNFNPNTGDFDFENEDVQHELKYPDQPKTIFGFLIAAFRKRKAEGLPSFTVLSCDNIQHNGDVARKMVLAFAQKSDSALADWIKENVSFPNTMVDRITPVTTPAAISYLENTYNLQDKWPVVCEPFIQWVVEDKFSNSRPSLEKLGVQFVKDVSPYEKMKIRLLNASHSVLGIPGAIHGHPTINACMEDLVFRKFMRQFIDKEVTPILGPIKGMDIGKYKDNLEERFSNPNIKDSVSRICSESSSKLPKFLIPTLQENLATEGSIKYATFILAAWCYYSDLGVNEKNDPIEIIDELKAELHQFASNTQKDQIAFIKQPDLFGNLANNQRFVKQYIASVQSIYSEKDIRKMMEKLIQ